MKWLNNWLLRRVRSAADQPEPNKLVAVSPRTIDSHGMNFTVYKADGGFVIEVRQYDRRTDTNNNKLHIIREDQDLGNELGKIISFEALRS